MCILIWGGFIVFAHCDFFVVACDELDLLIAFVVDVAYNGGRAFVFCYV